MLELVSIIVPIYNLENYLAQCLDSLINQTYVNIEIILVNDGSSDNSRDICDDYAKKDKRIIVLHKKNEGVSKARNDALDIMKGKYCIFVDGDDWLSLDFVEALYNQCKEDHSDMVFANHYRILGKNEEDVHKKYSYLPNQIFNSQEALIDFLSNSALTTGRIYKREVIQNHRFPVGIKLSEDEWMQCKIILEIKQISYNATAIYYRRVHMGSAMNQKFCMDDMKSLEIREKIAQMILEKTQDVNKFLSSFMTGRYAGALIKALESNNKEEAKIILKRYRYWFKKRRCYKADGLIMNIRYFLLALFPKRYINLKRIIKR